MSKAVIVTESVRDASALIAAGFKSAIPLREDNRLILEVIAMLKIRRSSTVFLALNADDTGDERARRIVSMLRTIMPSGQYCRIRPPEGLGIAEWIGGVDGTTAVDEIHRTIATAAVLKNITDSFHQKEA